MRTIDDGLTVTLTPPKSVHQRHLETLLQISRAIGSILDPAELAERVMRHVTEAFGADRSTLFLHDPHQNELWSQVAQGMEKDSQIRIADHTGLCGAVFHSQQPLLIDDTFESPHFSKPTAESAGYVPRSMLVVPILHRNGGCQGVLEVMDGRLGHFDESDLSLLEAIAVQVGISLENAKLYDAQRRQFHSFVRAFSAALDARDPQTQIHSVNVANYAMGIGHVLGLEHKELEWLRLAGLLHDVGKIATPEAVLLKPGALSKEEYEVMKQHALYSQKILSQIEFVDEYVGLDAIASAHHEKLDGTGYPLGLKAEQLPLKARILAVADIFHALQQDRTYRKGMETPAALAIIEKMTPHQLDERCVNALKTFLGVGVESSAGQMPSAASMAA